jgi:uncharacterized repeat protein (TIGR01451 family)
VRKLPLSIKISFVHADIQERIPPQPFLKGALMNHHDQPTSSKLRKIGIALVAALAVGTTTVVSTGTASAGPASLQPEMVISRVSSGATPWDATSFNPSTGTNAGTDSDAGNDIVRTGQLTNFRFDLNLNDPQAPDPELHGNYTVTMNPLPLGFIWDALPSVCTGAGSAITGDGKATQSKLVCNMGAKSTGDSFFMSGNVRALNSAHNGDSFQVSATVKVDDTTNTDAKQSVLTYATSSPRWDLTKRFSGVHSYTTFPDKTGVTKSGMVLRYNVGIKGPAGGGAEPLKEPIVIHDDISGVSPNAVFYPHAPGSWDACLPNYWGGPLPYGSLAIYNDARYSVGNSGTVSCPHAPDAQALDISVTGLDFSPAKYPTGNANGGTLPSDENYVASYAVLVFVPYEDLTPQGTQAENVLGALTGKGLYSDAPNFGPAGELGVGMNNTETAQSVTVTDDGMNNDYISTLYKPEPGAYDKFDYYHPWGGGVLAANHESTNLVHQGYTGSTYRSGDAYLTRNASYQGRHDIYVTGVRSFAAGIINCDTYDNRYVTVSALTENPNDAAWIYNTNGNSGAEWVLEYGVGGAGGDITTRLDGRTVWASNNEMRDGTCDNSDSPVWVTNINDAALAPYGGTAGITKIRARSTSVWTEAEQLASSYGIMIVNYTVRNDAPFGTIAANYGKVKWPSICPAGSNDWCNSSYDYTTALGNLGDRVTIVGSRVRITKDADRAAVAVGGDVAWTLKPVVGAPQAAGNNIATDVVITDTLPAELKYQAGSAACERAGGAVGSCEPDSLTNNGDGTQTLVWNLGNRVANVAITPITFKTDVVNDAPDGVNAENKVVIASVEDNTPQFDAAHPDNDRSDFKTVTLNNPKAFSVAKLLVTPIVEVNDDISFDLRYTNTSAAGYSTTDFIDWLPWNGDARTPPSNFTGASKLKSFTKTTGTQDVAVRYTNYNRASLTLPADLDPATANTSIPWCDAPGGGTLISGSGACPASIAEVTGVRLVGGPIDAGKRTIFRMTLEQSGNKGNDLYVNRFKGDVSGLALPVESNNVRARVYSGTIGNYVWKDLNGDGIQQGNEPVVPGVRSALSGTDRRGEAPRSIAATTDANGIYQFTDLVSTGANNFEVTFDPTSLPSGYVFTDRRVANTTTGLDSDADRVTGKTGPITLKPGAIDQTWDAGIVRLAKIDGNVYADLNDDGTFAASDKGLADIKITLTGIDGLGRAVTIFAVTDALGHYEFTNLWPGTYTVTETQADVDALNIYNDGKTTTGTLGSGSGATLVAPATVLGGHPNTITNINLTSDQDSLTNNFGEPFKPASLAGKVFVDNDNNGLQETGAPIKDVTVTLTGTDAFGNEVSPQTTTTDATGAYLFANLAPGTYKVNETQPAAFVDGKDSAGTIGGVVMGAVSGAAPVRDEISAITLTAGQNSVENNFAERTPAKLSGKVIDETNGNPIAGVVVVLTGTDDLGNAVTYTATTSPDGTYAFNNLRPGTYVVTESQPSGWIDGKTPVAPGTTGGTTSGANTINAITLVAGDDSKNNDFAEIKAARLAGVVWHDVDNNGLVGGAGETRIVGATVTLTGTNDLGVAISTTALTQADGTYAFEGLRPGTYTVTETQPAGGYIDGKDANGTGANNQGVLTNDTITGVVLVANDNSINNNFGEIKTASISGYSFVDSDRSGGLNTGDKRLENTSVALTGTDFAGNAVSFTTVTDADGFYEFAGLLPGTYVVTEVQPAGWVTGPDSAGMNGGTATTNKIAGIALQSGDAAKNYNLGELPTSDVSITKRVLESAPFNLGQNISYEVVVRNDGPTAATGVSVTDVMPTGVTYLSDNAAGTYNAATRVVTFPAGSLAVGGTKNIIITARLDSLTPGRNSVQVAAMDQADADSTPGNDVDPSKSNEDDDASVGLPPTNPAKIKGFVWADTNNDGIFDATESPILGASVKLTGIDALGNIVSVNDTTLADGSYLFDNLYPGTYDIDETTPSAFLDGKDANGTGAFNQGAATNDKITGIVLKPGNVSVTNNFGELKPSSIQGNVWSDANNDGIKDASESPISGVTVTLTGTDDFGKPVLKTVNTNPDGSYSFKGLFPGSYTITESRALGYLDGKDANGTGASSQGTLSNDLITGIKLDAGQDSIENNFGELLPASITGQVRDMTGAPVGIATVEMQLLDGTGAPVLDAAGTPKTATTKPDGSYSFSDLRPGTYQVKEVQPNPYLELKVLPGKVGTTANGAAGNNVISAITLNAGDAGVTYDFEEIKPATLSGKIFNEATKQPLEQNGVVVRVNVQLTNADGTDIVLKDGSKVPFLTTTTNEAGEYSFGDLRPGTYVVTEVQPSSFGFLDAKTYPGTKGGTGDSKTVISAVTLVAGDNSKDNNFSEYVPSSITGQVSNDFTGAPIGGVVVTITGVDDNGPFTKETKTGPDGNYTFPNLRPGTYEVTETQPSDWSDKSNPLGNSGGTADGFNKTKGIVLPASGKDVTKVDFTEIKLSSIAGVVYVDKNNDGVQQADEVGIPGIEMTLSGLDDLGVTVTKTVKTDLNGQYLFEKLRPSAAGYTVTEAEPLAYVDGTETPGTLAGATTPSTSVNDQIIVPLNPERISAANNFGERPLSVLSGKVTQGNVAGDSSGKGIGGVTITLTGTDDKNKPFTMTTTTKADGTYKFENLRPGTYVVTETQPDGWEDAKNLSGVNGSNGGNVASNATSAMVIGANDAATGYDFTEVKLVGVSGIVHLDANDDGLVANDTGLAVVTITLSGTDDRGNSVSKTAVTDSTGAYKFENLRPGKYSVTESTDGGAAKYNDGKDAAGDTVGGAGSSANAVAGGAKGDEITMTLDPSTLDDASAPGALVSENNNFGELPLSQVSGTVFMENDKTPISGVTITLTGTDDLGKPVSLSVLSGVDGSYEFKDLRPGTYTLTETQPAGLLDGETYPGSKGGSKAVNVISAITLGANTASVNNNFSAKNAETLKFEPVIPEPTPAVSGGTPPTVPAIVTSTPSAPAPSVPVPTVPTSVPEPTKVAPVASVTTLPPTAAPNSTVAATVASTIAQQQDCNATVKGAVFVDLNRNGKIDASEKGVRGIIIRLTGIDGKEYVITSTDRGAFNLVCVPAGTYEIDIVGGLKPGSKLTTKTKAVVLGEKAEVVEQNVGLPTFNSVAGIVAEADLELALSLTGGRSLDMTVAAGGLVAVGGALMLMGRRRRLKASK